MTNEEINDWMLPENRALYPLALAIVNEVADLRCGVTIPRDAREEMARMIVDRFSGQKGRDAD